MTSADAKGAVAITVERVEDLAGAYESLVRTETNLPYSDHLIDTARILRAHAAAMRECATPCVLPGISVERIHILSILNGSATT